MFSFPFCFPFIYLRSERHRHLLLSELFAGKSPKSWWTCSTRTDLRYATRGHRSSWSQTSSAIWRTFRSSPMDLAARPSSPPSPPFRYYYYRHHRYYYYYIYRYTPFSFRFMCISFYCSCRCVCSRHIPIFHVIYISNLYLVYCRTSWTSLWSISTRCTRRRWHQCPTSSLKTWTRNNGNCNQQRWGDALKHTNTKAKKLICLFFFDGW